MPLHKTTIKDIAREAGVSPALVSFVMRNERQGMRVYPVKEETTRQVLDVARRLDYRPNASAKALRDGRSETLGVIVSDIANPFFAEIARNIEDEASRQGYTVLFGSSDESIEKLQRLLGVFRAKGVDGLVVAPCEGSESLLQRCRAEGLPVVLLDRSIEGIPSVVLDNRGAAVEMTRRLIDKGFRKIEMVSYALDLPNIRQREEGYAACMEEAGLATYVRIQSLGHRDSALHSDTLVRDARERGVEAFLFATNSVAVNCMRSIFREGFQVPQDFGIATFDRNDAFDIYPTDLLYAAQPTEAFASTCVQTLLDLVAGKADVPDAQVFAPVITDTSC